MTDDRKPTASGNGAGPEPPRLEPDQDPSHPAAPLDPRGVRVTVLAVDDLGGVNPVVIEPAPEPLVMGEPSGGVGLLGGVAVTQTPPATPPTERELTIDGEPVAAHLRRLDDTRAVLESPSTGEAGKPAPTARLLLLPAEPSGARDGAEHREVVIDGWRFEVEVEPAARAALRDRARRGRDEAGRSGPTDVRAIIPGVVVSVSVTAGDEVTAGQQLLVVEAMKMQNELRAPRDGTIERVATAPGATIEVGDLLLVIA